MCKHDAQMGIKPEDLAITFKNQFADRLILQHYLDKLVEDNYIKQSTWSNNKGEKGLLYYKSIRGEIYSQTGGYQNAHLQSLQVLHIRNRQMVNETILKVLTLVIAVGTAIAAAYYLIEIGKYFHWWK